MTRAGARRTGSTPVPPWLFGLAEPEPRPVLTPELIIRTAHRLVHEGGIEALSLRNLAAALGVGTTAIYSHIGTKENLLVAVADLVLSEVPIPASVRRSKDWRTALRTLSHSVRRVLMAHPHIHPVLDTHVMVTPATLRIAEACVGLLRTAGLAGADLVHAYNAWIGYVVGFAILETKPTPRSDADELRRGIQAYLRNLDAASYPNIVAASTELLNRAYALRWELAPLGQRGASFEWGLEGLLDTFERRGAGTRSDG